MKLVLHCCQSKILTCTLPSCDHVVCVVPHWSSEEIEFHPLLLCGLRLILAAMQSMKAAKNTARVSKDSLSLTLFLPSPLLCAHVPNIRMTTVDLESHYCASASVKLVLNYIFCGQPKRCGAVAQREFRDSSAALRQL